MTRGFTCKPSRELVHVMDPRYRAATHRYSLGSRCSEPEADNIMKMHYVWHETDNFRDQHCKCLPTDKTEVSR